MALPAGILPSASIAHGNGSTDVFSLLVVWLTIASNHSSASTTDELVQHPGIVLRCGDNTAYRVVVDHHFYPSPFSSCNEELVVIGSRTTCQGANIWKSQFFPSASSVCDEGLLIIVGARADVPIVDVDTASRLVGRKNILVTMFKTLCFFCIISLGLCIGGVLYRNPCKDRFEQPRYSELIMASFKEAEVHHRKSLKPFQWTASRRFRANSDLHVKLLWALRLEILCPFASVAICMYLHKMYQCDGIFTLSVMLMAIKTLSDLKTENTIGKRNELTENQSHHRYPDSSGAQHGSNDVKAKPSAAWVAATAAPHHATGNFDLFSGVVIEHDAQFVHATDSVPRKVVGRGTVITDTVVLPDVWFVPGLRENLVSVSQLADLDHSIGFGRGECCIRSAGDGKIIGKGRLKQGGQYVLDFLKVPLTI